MAKRELFYHTDKSCSITSIKEIWISDVLGSYEKVTTAWIYSVHCTSMCKWGKIHFLVVLKETNKIFSHTNLYYEPVFIFMLSYDVQWFLVLFDNLCLVHFVRSNNFEEIVLWQMWIRNQFLEHYQASVCVWCTCR